jgi:hypothetical protein
MSKFSDYFSEPQHFTDGTWVIDGSFDRTQAALEISAAIGDEVEPESLELGLVRFGFPPEFVQDRDDFDGPIWYTGAKKGKGSKSVWIF